MRSYKKVISAILKGEKNILSFFEEAEMDPNDGPSQLAGWWLWRDDGGDGYERYVERLEEQGIEVDKELLDAGRYMKTWEV